MKKLIGRNNSFLLSIFLSFFLLYCSIVSIYLSFLKNQQFDFRSVFFTLTLVSLFLFSVRQFYQIIFLPKIFINGLKKIKKNKKLSILLIICFLNLIIGFYGVYSQYPRTPHNGEIYQSFSVFRSNNAMRESYRQQQPPLDYYFSSFSNQLLGKSKFAIRFHSMMFYLLLSFILPLLLYFFCPSFLALGFGAFLFSLNHVVRLNSVNGRPLSLALLTGFLFLFFYMFYCKDDNYKKNNSLFPVIASQYLFVMSIGFQPVVFIISLFISSFYLLFQNRKTVFKKLFLSHIVTALLSLPFYIKMYSFGRGAYKFKKPSFNNINSYMENYDILDLLKKYFYPFYEQLTPFLLLLLCGLVVVIFIRKKIPGLIFQIGIALIIFPLFFDFLFKMIMNWNVFNRYFIVWSLFLIFFFVMAFYEISQYLKRKKWKIRFLLIPVSVLFLWNSYSQILAINQESRFRAPYRDDSVKKTYDYLKEKGGPKDIYFEISLVQPPVYREDPLNNLKFFFYDPKVHPIKGNYQLTITETPPFFYEQTGDKIYYINWKQIPKTKNQKIFFIAVNDQTDAGNKTPSILSRLLQEKRIGRLSIFKWILKGKNREKEYKEFLSNLIEQTPPKYRASLYETLLYYACKNKNRIYSAQLLREYKALEFFLDKQTGYGSNLPYRFELRRRAKLFQNKDFCEKED